MKEDKNEEMREEKRARKRKTGQDKRRNSEG